ncbi:MAG: hypothetical protein JWP24_3106 [Marmoricola sp.]|nr:hypothetical protein [Marmoricola sp.]
MLAAVKAKYPDATVERAETDSEGVYEAHIVNGGSPLTVQVGKDFTITGTDEGHGGGRGAPGDHDRGDHDQGDHHDGGHAGRPGGAPPTESSSFRTS